MPDSGAVMTTLVAEQEVGDAVDRGMRNLSVVGSGGPTQHTQKQRRREQQGNSSGNSSGGGGGGGNVSDEDDDDDDEDGPESALRCMFDACMATSTLSIALKQTQEKSSAQSVLLVTAEDQEPGALQSGMYLWPASRALCDAMMDALDALTATSTDIQRGSYVATDAQVGLPCPPRVVVELGAGCGLVGVSVSVRLRALGSPPEAVILTDRDAKLLEMMGESISLNSIDDTTSACAHEWGPPPPTSSPCELDVQLNRLDSGLDLILGADLMYSTETIGLLFETVEHLLKAHGRSSTAAHKTMFVLCSSFRVEQTTDMVIEQCRQRGLARRVARDNIASGGVIIEEFWLVMDACLS